MYEKQNKESQKSWNTERKKKKKTEFREVEKNQIMQGFKDPK